MRFSIKNFVPFFLIKCLRSADSTLELNVHINVKQTFMKLFIFRECLPNATALQFPFYKYSTGRF